MCRFIFSAASGHKILHHPTYQLVHPLLIPCESRLSLSHSIIYGISLSSTVSEEECSVDDLCYDNVRCILDDDDEEDDAELVSGFDCECPCNDGFYCSESGECEGIYVTDMILFIN